MGWINCKCGKRSMCKTTFTVYHKDENRFCQRCGGEKTYIENRDALKHFKVQGISVKIAGQEFYITLDEFLDAVKDRVVNKTANEKKAIAFEETEVLHPATEGIKVCLQ